MSKASFALALAATALLCGPAAAGGGSGIDLKAQLYKKAVETHPSQGDVREIPGSEAVKVTTKEGIFVSLKTNELVPGNAYTMWFVAINNPEVCDSSPCTGKDVLTRSQAVKSDVGYADGLIAGADGAGHFSTFQPVGELPHAWLGGGLTHPKVAEIHLVIHDHGPVIPGREAAMTQSYRDGCADDSLPAIVPEATAKANGMSGPNTCKLVQDVIFEPGSMVASN